MGIVRVYFYKYFKLSYIELRLKLGYSRKEVSDILDISEDAVQKRLLRSRVHFHDHEKGEEVNSRR